MVEDSDEERVTVNGQALSPEEALALARDLIAVLSSPAAQRELSTPVIEDERKPSVEEPGNEP
jgi:hypothetical protein